MFEAEAKQAGKASNPRGGWSPGATLSRQRCGPMSWRNSGQQWASAHCSCLHHVLKAAPPALIPSVSTSSEEIGSERAPKSTRTDQAHRRQGNSPAISYLDEMSSVTSAAHLQSGYDRRCLKCELHTNGAAPDMWPLKPLKPPFAFPQASGLGPIRVLLVSMETMKETFPTLPVLPSITSRLAFLSPYVGD